MKEKQRDHPVELPFLKDNNICIWDAKGNYVHINKNGVMLVGDLFITISSNKDKAKPSLLKQNFIFNNIYEIESKIEYLHSKRNCILILLFITIVVFLIGTLVFLQLM